MCIIMVQPAGDERMPNAYLKNAWDGNDDGAGIMYSDGEQVVIEKPYWTYRAFRKAYNRVWSKYGETSAIVLHLRITTHGPNTADNTHPHTIPGSECGFAHNGILRDFIPTDKKISDTVLFGRSVLAYRTTEQLMGEDFAEVLSDVIGFGNKLAIMDPAGNVRIVNAEAGEFEDGRWFSNGSYKGWIGLMPSKSAKPNKPKRAKRVATTDGRPDKPQWLRDEDDWWDSVWDVDDDSAVDDYHTASLEEYPTEEVIERAAWEAALFGVEPDFDADMLTESDWQWFRHCYQTAERSVEFTPMAKD
jgi:hypothetical protein